MIRNSFTDGALACAPAIAGEPRHRCHRNLMTDAERRQKSQVVSVMTTTTYFRNVMTMRTSAPPLETEIQPCARICGIDRDC